MYRRLFLVRRSEETIQAHYHKDEMKTPVHLSIGQEAVPVGVCAELRSRDRIFATYRSHAVYLARTLDTDGFFAAREDHVIPSQSHVSFPLSPKRTVCRRTTS